jgi:alcohol dehydrogenase
LETYVCNKRSPMSECYSREAWQMLADGFSRVLDDPTDIEARGRMQLGACFAGMAIEASMLGAAHALANPLTAMLGVPHGQAVGLMMPHVIRFNGQTVNDRYEQLAKNLPTHHQVDNRDTASHRLAELFTQWLKKASLATSLEELNQWLALAKGNPEQTQTLLRELARSATKQWTATFNPRAASETDMLALYQSALS